MKKNLQRVEYDAWIDYLEGEGEDADDVTEDDLPTEEDWQAESYRQKVEEQS